MRELKLKKCLVLLSTILCSAIAATAGDSGNLRVGAAKIDITPKSVTGLTGNWSKVFQGIHDHIYLRAIVLDNGLTSAALVAGDLTSFPESSALRRRIEQETGIPAEHILISATHTHNAPSVSSWTPVVTPSSPQPAAAGAPAARVVTAESVAFAAAVQNALVEVVRQAKDNLQAGKMGLATGRADININRDEFVGDRWKTGRNPTRPSEKTVWVVRFDNAAGEPIALFVNYAVHPLLMGPDNPLVTGDVPGLMSQFVESYYKDKLVALYTQGPAGDQNLIASSWDLDNVLTRKVREPGEQGWQLGDALARILGEEVIRVGESVRNPSSTASIWSMSKNATCPAAPAATGAAPAGAPAGRGAQPAPINMTLLMINQVALAGIANEVVTNIYWHLKQDSPLTNTIMVSVTNGGGGGYVADDAAYGTGIFEARNLAYKNCGEDTIVNFFVDAINRRLSTMDARK
jgi:neutral ceramidase